MADLAVAYIYGIATSHGFSDGNKRTACVIGRLFLALNDQTLVFDQVDTINFMLTVADWIRQRLTV